ncbi:MAG: hypothetical protein K2O39_07870, partial [Clostridiales bacterium]|nr:hypothetical protein [Clostridiales bacterium]
KDFATVTVTVKNSNGQALDMNNKPLSEFAASLEVGSYTITAAIADSVNYTVTGEQSITIVLYVAAIQNAWQDVTVDDNTITAAQWTDGYTWTFTRGEVISVMLPKSVIGAVKITFNNVETSYTTSAALNGYLNSSNLAAGEYTLRFAVEEDVNGNYTGLISNCTVVINKKSNDWIQELESVTASGSIDATSFTMPTANVYQVNAVDLRIFNIVKAGARPSDWYTAEEFLTELGKLANGTYTIAARIGGDVRPATADSSFIQALNLYNADYEEISCSCTVMLAPAENTWTTKLSDKSWTWGDTVSATLSAAKFGNDQIIYTISGSGISTITIKTSECDNVLTELNNAINGLHPGTYTITASIVGTDLYAAPTESNVALLTVSKYAASWDGYTNEDLAEYGLLNVTWKQATSSLLPALTVKYMNSSGVESTVGATVVWNIGKYSFDDIIAALNERDANTYTITATYAGDDYNEELIFTAIVTVQKAEVVWSSATVNADKQYSWVLGADDNTSLVQPTLDNAGDCTVTYTLIKVGGTGTLYSGGAWNGTNSLSSVLAAQKAGAYEITATAVGNTTNYLLPADVTYTLTVSAQANTWLNPPATTITWTYKSAENTVIAFVPAHNNDKLTITVGGESVSPSDLMDELRNLGVGSYSIVASVSATDEYAAIDPYTV